MKVIKKHTFRVFLGALVLVITGLLLSPMPRFTDPCSTVVLASDGQLLGARIASDGQWRFPANDTIPEKFITCLTRFEDRYFYYHPGVNLYSLARAIRQNFSEGRIVSGGSTISMQVARIASKGHKRNVWNKFVEICSAIKLELFRSKKSILAIYASNAPFGGNVVGMDAACWRYFGHDPENLSWAEAATLAVLPNAPSLIFPGNNDQKLKLKRDKLLKTLLDDSKIENLDYELAISEPVPQKPYLLPDHSFHLTERLHKSRNGERILTTINYSLQKQVGQMLNMHSEQLASQYIFNAGALVIDVKANTVLAYIGNSKSEDIRLHNNQVDMITASRSTGSILKPFLYASMLSDGEMLPNTILPDVPVYLSGYTPKNFDYTFHGAVSASQALSWSLNIPAIYMLKEYGIDRFLDKLKNFGFTSFRKNSDHYGLSLILGGGETSLMELCSAYAGMARTLTNYDVQKKYFSENFSRPLFEIRSGKSNKTETLPIISAASTWFTFQALKEVNRPEERSGWRNFHSSQQVAWKTGTSFGFRDAWAIATTPQYVVGVWVGNSNGEGRPGLTGVTSAAPLMFNILDLLPASEDFIKPEEEVTTAEVCAYSGYRLGKHCQESVTIKIPESGLKTAPCPYCQSVKIKKPGNAGQNSITDFEIRKWFILPPAMEYYYRKFNPSYVAVPYNSAESGINTEMKVMEFIYPGANDKIYIPKSLDGTTSVVVFEAAHRNPSAKIFWHLDQSYIGTTTYIHQKELQPSPGQHLITLTDEQGNTLKRVFTILDTSDGK